MILLYNFPQFTYRCLRADLENVHLSVLLSLCNFVLNMLEDSVSRCGHIHTTSSIMSLSSHFVESSTGSPGPWWCRGWKRFERWMPKACTFDFGRAAFNLGNNMNGFTAMRRANHSKSHWTLRNEHRKIRYGAPWVYLQPYGCIRIRNCPWMLWTILNWLFKRRDQNPLPVERCRNGCAEAWFDIISAMKSWCRVWDGPKVWSQI